MEKYRNSPHQIRLPLYLTLAIAGGIFIGAKMFGPSQNYDKLDKNLRKMREILTLIDRDYVDTVNLDQLTEFGITQVLDKLDPHSVYIPPKEVELAKAPLQGGFDGIGVEFYIMKDTVEVVTPISGGPSEAVGVKAGDKIVAVDGKTIAGIGITNRDVFTKLRGPKGTKVNISVMRRGEKKPLDFTITRDKIPFHSVDVSYMVDKTTGYIKVSRFAENTADEFAEAMKNLKTQGMKRLMIDMRDNPGGLMDKAVYIADDLLKENSMIVYTKGKDPRNNRYLRASSFGNFEKGAVVVLVNEGSASASEIVSGAIQDNDRGLIVGRRTFGKGLVQAPINLSDNSELRLTISRYYTPSGRSIQKPYGNGIKEYEEDFEQRIKQGELFNKDSIKFTGKEKFLTSAGRTVFAGGGIMPDVFVPIDTIKNSRYSNMLFNKNVIREYAMDYATKNKKDLEAKGLEAFVSGFKVTDVMLDEVIKAGTKAGVNYNDKQFQVSKEVLANGVKAFIGRQLWRDQGFYPVFHQMDDVFQAGIKGLNEAGKIEGMKKVKTF